MGSQIDGTRCRNLVVALKIVVNMTDDNVMCVRICGLIERERMVRADLGFKAFRLHLLFDVVEL